MWYLAHGVFRRVFAPSITAFQPDVVHGHDGLALPLTVRVAQASGAICVFDSHELEAHRNHPLIWAMRPRIQALERRFLPRVNAVLTVSRTIASHLEEHYAIKRPTVLYNAPPRTPAPLPQRWKGSPRMTVRYEAELNATAVLLVYTGNIATGRGIEQTLQNLAELQLFEDLAAGSFQVDVPAALEASYAFMTRFPSPRWRQERLRLELYLVLYRLRADGA